MEAHYIQLPIKEPLKIRYARSAMPAASQLPGWKWPTDIPRDAHAPDDDEVRPSHFMT